MCLKGIMRWDRKYDCDGMQLTTLWQRDAITMATRQLRSFLLEMECKEEHFYAKFNSAPLAVEMMNWIFQRCNKGVDPSCDLKLKSQKFHCWESGRDFSHEKYLPAPLLHISCISWCIVYIRSPSVTAALPQDSLADTKKREETLQYNLSPVMNSRQCPSRRPAAADKPTHFSLSVHLSLPLVFFFSHWFLFLLFS